MYFVLVGKFGSQPRTMASLNYEPDHPKTNQIQADIDILVCIRAASIARNVAFAGAALSKERLRQVDFEIFICTSA